MAQINLLPWREEERNVKRIFFLIRVLGCVILTIFLLILYHLYLDGKLNAQDKESAFLQAELTQEQANLAVLDKKKKEKDAIEAKLKFILSLRNTSYQAVRLLDEITRVVPEAVTLNKMTREKNMITITGKSQSNLQVTQFMKNLAQSKIFMQPVLTEISAKENMVGEERIFTLKVTQRE